MKFILVLVVFFMLISLIIINNHGLHVFEKEDFHVFIGDYYNWLKTFSSNVKIITGNIVKQNWLPE